MKFLKIFRRVPKTPEERFQLRKEQLYLLLSGLLMAIGFPPIPYPITLFFGMIPYLYVIDKRETLAGINRATYLFAFFFSIFALYWVGAFTQAKDAYLMLGGALLFFANPIAFLIPSTIYFITKKKFSSNIALISFPVFWVCYEYVYTLTDWSFPWLNIGNGACNFTRFIQIADIIGAPGLSLIIMSINIALFFVVKHYPSNKRMMNIGITAANVLLFLPLIYGIIRLGSVAATNTKAVTVGIVQPNLDPYDKWAGNNAAEITAGLLSDAGKLAAQDVDLIIFPETAIPVYFNSGAAVGIRDSVFGFINRRSIPILTGVADLQIYPPGSAMPPDVKFAPGADFYYTTYNGIYVIQPGAGVTQRYGKMKLVPFGEHVPFVDQIPMLGDLMRWSVGIGGWNIGKDTTVMNVYSKRLNDTVRIGGVVCYESIYGDLVARFTARGAQLLAVVTNDSWYGNTSGPYQHRDFAKLRAVENRRYVVRCANGGISCAIDPLGEIVNQSKMYEHTTMRMAVIPRNEITFFVRHPLLISHLCVFITLWFLGLALLLSIKQMLERYRPKGNHQLEGTE